MSTRMKFSISIFGFSLICLTSLSAQTSPPSGTPVPSRRPRQQPCWQQAGISASAVQRYREITANAHREIESVCSNSSLPSAEKQQKIHQIHQETQQQVESLVTPQQKQAFESCRSQRGEARGMHSGNPCGSLSGATLPHEPPTPAE